jgi:hypothetical protein
VSRPSSPEKLGGTLSRESLLNATGEEISQQHMQAVEGTGALSYQILAPFGEQPQHLGAAVGAVLRRDPS